MNIGVIQKGVVIDHIRAGKAMEVYNYLHLDDLDCSVAVIKNVESKHIGKKDIIKIEDRIDLDLEVLGYIDPNITINIVENSVITEKKQLSLPQQIVNVVKCKNPRCITSIEQELEQIFRLTGENKKVYRCVYCEQSAK